jgi:hypothetical protein
MVLTKARVGWIGLGKGGNLFSVVLILFGGF